MAKLSDYGIKVDDIDSSKKIKIRGAEFPVDFHVKSMEYVADVYNDDYSEFEKDTNDLLSRMSGKMTMDKLSANDLRIMRCLIYSMLRTGGLDEDEETIYRLLGIGNDLLRVYGVCMEIFTAGAFQVEDLKKSKKPQDFQKSSKKTLKK
ncbi:hypothetical protein AB6884_03440 [Carnobacterium maltaromaticum]|uniref:hypothetical protein n=1 Tax=Carnobacterium maltaromaticum TaxID=2751 RepID=UPI0039BE1AE6